MAKKKEIAEASDVGSGEVTEDTIRTRAYELFEQRGYENGHELDDWLEAEAELIGKKPVVPADQNSTQQKVPAA